MISRCRKWPDLGGGCEPRSGHLRQSYITLYEAPASLKLLSERLRDSRNFGLSTIPVEELEGVLEEPQVVLRLGLADESLEVAGGHGEDLVNYRVN